MPQIKHFKGLNNVSDPIRLGMEWLAVANNVNVTDSGAVEKRSGYSLVETGQFTGAYSTLDFQRAYLVDAGELRTIDGAVLKTGLTSAPMHWAEINNHVYFNNGTDRGIILPDNEVLDWAWSAPAAPTYTVTSTGQGGPASVFQAVLTTTLPDGRETGTGEFVTIEVPSGDTVTFAGAGNLYTTERDGSVFQRADGDDLRHALFDPLPTGTDVIQFFAGRAHASQYMPESDQSIVWISEPLAFHLFNLNSGFILLPGKVTMLAPHADALIIGTSTRVFSYDGTKLIQLADYGVVPGQHWAVDDKRILFWTLRGVCAALPFTNLTERQVSVAPGVHAGGTIVRSGGQKRYVVALQQGGAAFNSYI